MPVSLRRERLLWRWLAIEANKARRWSGVSCGHTSLAFLFHSIKQSASVRPLSATPNCKLHLREVCFVCGWAAEIPWPPLDDHRGPCFSTFTLNISSQVLQADKSYRFWPKNVASPLAVDKLWQAPKPLHEYICAVVWILLDGNGLERVLNVVVHAALGMLQILMLSTEICSFVIGGICLQKSVDPPHYYWGLRRMHGTSLQELWIKRYHLVYSRVVNVRGMNRVIVGRDWMSLRTNRMNYIEAWHWRICEDVKPPYNSVSKSINMGGEIGLESR